jgi:hypothetical protein
MQYDEIHLRLLMVTAGRDLEARDNYEFLGKFCLQPLKEKPFRVGLILTFDEIGNASGHGPVMETEIR